MRPPLSPAEHRLLRGLVLDPSRLTHAATCDPSIRWTALGMVAARHGVGPLLYRGLRALEGGGALPAPARRLRDRCRAAYVQTVARNTLIFAELARILPPLRACGIPVILLKGAAVTGALFGDIGLRHLGDLDLLVPLDARARARAVLERLDYHLVPGVPADLQARGRRAGVLPARPTLVSAELTAQLYERFHFHYYLERDRQPRQPFPLELHWHIVKPGRRIRIDDWWQGARPLRVGGVDALAFGPEHALLHFALHLAQDDYTQLRLARLIDVHLAVTKQTLDWARLRRIAEQHDAARALGVALDLSHRVLGTPVPDSLQGLLGGLDRALVARLTRHWVAQLTPRAPDRPPFRQTLAWTVLKRDRWQSVPGPLYRRLASYPETNPRLPERYRGSELMNFLYAFHPVRFAPVTVRRPKGEGTGADASDGAYGAGVPRSA